MIWGAATVAILFIWVGIGLTARETLTAHAGERRAFALLKLQERTRFLPDSVEALPPEKAREVVEEGQWLAVLEYDVGASPRLVPVRGDVPASVQLEELVRKLDSSRLIEGALESPFFGPAPLWIGFAKRAQHYWILGQAAAPPAQIWSEWTSTLAKLATMLALVAFVLAGAAQFWASRRARAAVTPAAAQGGT